MDYYSDSSFNGVLAGLGISLVILVLAVGVILVIANWKLYVKAGKGGWEAIVPVYGYWVLIEIAGLEWWWFILIIFDSVVNLFGLDGISPVANLVSLFATFNCYYNIAKKFNKNNGTAVCAGVFSSIFTCIFAFSKNEVYNANIPVSKNGVFGTPEVNNNVDNTNYYTQSNDVSTGSVDMMNNTTQANIGQDFSYCGNCGTKINKDIRFCPNCGKENV